jgi:hypothetical protein
VLAYLGPLKGFSYRVILGHVPVADLEWGRICVQAHISSITLLQTFKMRVSVSHCLLLSATYTIAILNSSLLLQRHNGEPS